MTYQLIHGDARHVSDVLEPASVDLIVTSPPYFALRSYRDECDACDGTGEYREGVEARPPPRVKKSENGLGKSTLNGHGGAGSNKDRALNSDTTGKGDGCPACNGSGRSHYDGQLGSEATPGEFIDALIECTEDWLKVLKPGGSIFVNLGDKRATPRPSGTSIATGFVTGKSPDELAALKSMRPKIDTRAFGIAAKSLMLLPHRYAIACIERLGLIVRADMVWHKPNGLPESVTDRVRQSHEYWFHLTREPRYFAAVDEIREGYSPATESFQAMKARFTDERTDGVLAAHTGNKLGRDSDPHGGLYRDGGATMNPLGKLPGSVWTIPSEPLTVPAELGVDHFAAFPSEWPRRLILGWSPTGWCEACSEARRPVVEKGLEQTGVMSGRTKVSDLNEYTNARGWNGAGYPNGTTTATILGYRCACPDTTAPTRPAVILDPFAGTGTTVAVAHHLGRHGIGIDLSRDYLRLAEWRCTSDTRLRDKILDRSDMPAAPKIDGQLSLEDLL